MKYHSPPHETSSSSSLSSRLRFPSRASPSSTFSSSLRLSSSPSSCSSSTSLQPKFSQLEAPASPAPFPAPPLAPPLLLPPPFLIAQLVARNSCSGHPPRLANIFTASPTVLPPHKSLLRLHPCADIFRCPYQQLPLVLLPPLIPAPSRVPVPVTALSHATSPSPSSVSLTVTIVFL
ncbi:hypothetical protein BGW80DRAFT_1287047, partial [Lactifluus volemus]